jgi:membrane protease YdiL (CAAX protease family)
LTQRAFPVRVTIFVLMLAVPWLPVATLLAWLIPDANLVTILTMGLLFLMFLGLLRWWVQRVRRDEQGLKRYGLVWTRRNGHEFLLGLGLGLTLLSALFLLQGVLGWLTWQSSPYWFRFLLEGSLVGLGTAFAEELMFRGWLQDELEEDYSPVVALWSGAIAYALLHFIKPLDEVLHTLPQFFGLMLLGLALLWAKRSTGRLGLPIGLHMGLVWGYYLIDLSKLVVYTDRVPAWVTGINRNPLAGLLGIGVLLMLVLAMRARARRASQSARQM